MYMVHSFGILECRWRKKLGLKKIWIVLNSYLELDRKCSEPCQVGPNVALAHRGDPYAVEEDRYRPPVVIGNTPSGGWKKKEKKERMAGGGLSVMVVVLPCDERLMCLL